jgi:myosin protein heavy chain
MDEVDEMSVVDEEIVRAVESELIRSGSLRRGASLRVGAGMKVGGKERKDSSFELPPPSSTNAHQEEEVVYLNLDSSHSDDGTLIGHDPDIHVGEKEIEMEIDEDSASQSDSDEQGEQQSEECGVKRKRTIRVIIRSRAFL